MKLTILFFILLITADRALAFDVEGFVTDMSKAQVIDKAKKYSKLQEIDTGTLIATWANGYYLSFNFCEGVLVSIQQGHPPELKHLALLVAEFNQAYGEPFSVGSKTRSHPNGPITEMGYWWKAGEEFVSVYYMGMPDNDSLSTSHQSKNSCFKVPR